MVYIMYLLGDNQRPAPASEQQGSGKFFMSRNL